MKLKLTIIAAATALTTAAHAGTWYENEGNEYRDAELAKTADYIRSGDMNALSFQLGYFGAIANICPIYDFDLHPAVEGYALMFEELFHEEGTSDEMHEYARQGGAVFYDRIRNHYGKPACEIAAGEGFVTEQRGWW